MKIDNIEDLHSPGSFNLENTFLSWWLTDSIDKVLKNFHVNFDKNPVECRITKNSMDYSARKFAIKMEALPSLGLFDLENGSFWSWWPIDSIDKFFADIRVNFLPKWTRNFGWPKKWCTIIHKISKLGGIHAFGLV